MRRSAADRQNAVHDQIPPAAWDVHVWDSGPQRGRLDQADRMRLIERILEADHHLNQEQK